MAKLTLAVAALVALSLAGSRLQAQAEQQLATFDQPMVAQDAPVIAQDAPAVAADAPVVADVSPEAAPQIAPDVAPLQLADASTIAQDAPPVAAEAAASTGPSMDASTLSPRLKNTASHSANAMRRPSRGSGVGLMIFGGAALITGLIIGNNAGTVIAVGGALVGLYGLYVYLGRPTGMEQGSRIGLGYKLNTN